MGRKPKGAEPNWVIYKTTNLINNKCYIGKDKYNNPKYIGSGLILKQAIKKYGIENFKKEVIEICDSQPKCDEREIFWIKEINSFYPIGYNINTGGKGGDNITNNPNKKEIILTFSKSNAGRKISIEERARRSLDRKGKSQNPCKKTKCPNCNYVGDIRNMIRWHFDKCKSLIGIKTERCPHCTAIIKKCNHIIHYNNCIKNPNVDMEQHIHIKNNYMKLVYKERNYIPTEEHKKKISLGSLGRKKTRKTKKLHKESFKKRWIKIKESNIFYTCKYCEIKSISLGNMIRWHNDNCKKKLK